MLGSLRSLSSVEGPVSRFIGAVFVQEQLALFGACTAADGPRCFSRRVLDRLKMGCHTAGMAVCLRSPCDPMAHCTRTTTRHLIRLDHCQASSHTSPSLAEDDSNPMAPCTHTRPSMDMEQHAIGLTNLYGRRRNFKFFLIRVQAVGLSLAAHNIMSPGSACC